MTGLTSQPCEIGIILQPARREWQVHYQVESQLPINDARQLNRKGSYAMKTVLVHCSAKKHVRGRRRICSTSAEPDHGINASPGCAAVAKP